MVLFAPPEMLSQLKAYLRQILGFMGIEDVQTVRAEGTNIPPLAIHAVPNSETAIEALEI